MSSQKKFTPVSQLKKVKRTRAMQAVSDDEREAFRLANKGKVATSLARIAAKDEAKEAAQAEGKVWDEDIQCSQPINDGTFMTFPDTPGSPVTKEESDDEDEDSMVSDCEDKECWTAPSYSFEPSALGKRSRKDFADELYKEFEKHRFEDENETCFAWSKAYELDATVEFLTSYLKTLNERLAEVEAKILEYSEGSIIPLNIFFFMEEKVNLTYEIEDVTDSLDRAGCEVRADQLEAERKEKIDEAEVKRKAISSAAAAVLSAIVSLETKKKNEEPITIDSDEEL